MTQMPKTTRRWPNPCWGFPSHIFLFILLTFRVYFYMTPPPSLDYMDRLVEGTGIIFHNGEPITSSVIVGFGP